MHDNDTAQQDRQLDALLRDYTVPGPGAGFFDRALLRATHEGARRQRTRWMAAGFGGAIAAGLAAWVVSAFLLSAPGLPEAEAPIPGVTMALEEPRKVNLVFSSGSALETATLTVSLPPGVELQGFPGQREITWETSLEQGKNVLPLTLVALTPAGGELLARLEHDNRSRTFRLQLDIS
jgi:hypothetical protein